MAVDKFHSWIKYILLAQVAILQLHTIFPFPFLGIIKLCVLLLVACFVACDMLFWHSSLRSHACIPVFVGECVLFAALFSHYDAGSPFVRGVYIGIYLFIFLLIPLSTSRGQLAEEQNNLFIIGILVALVPLLGSFIVGYLARGIEPETGPWYWDQSHHLFMGDNPNRWGRVIAILFMMLWYLVMTNKENKYRLLSALMLIPTSVSIFIFQCRGALMFLLAFLFWFGLLYLHGKPRKQMAYTAGWICLGCLGLFILTFHQKTATSFHLLQSPLNTSGRGAFWQTALANIKAHPFLGSRTNTFLPFADGSPFKGNTHNEFLGISLYWGIPFACIVFGIFSYCLLYPICRARNLFESKRFSFQYAILVACVVQGLVERSIIYYNKMLAPVYFIVAGYILYEIGTYRNLKKTQAIG